MSLILKLLLKFVAIIVFYDTPPENPPEGEFLKFPDSISRVDDIRLIFVLAKIDSITYAAIEYFLFNKDVIIFVLTCFSSLFGNFNVYKGRI
jgi:hypothetical protein